ncbi:hypothetical protein GCM10007916_27810 [Psychromonas marina]|uniref:HPt domain-containing protein n=1 Tax=Psychromonas marina TaxID=88364 RepID=A0ABQ6E3X5_9GAMM|nr:Hpt domain-containing protein [Psychromonas marina]GLS91711.1 hypothetical protein GCM10007916_27810 [Psychromonas marina]
MINIEMLTEMFGGDTEFVSTIFQQYLSDNKDINTRIEEQVNNEQYDTLFHTMHTLSGSLSNICDENIVPTIKTVEQLARDGEQPNADDIQLIQTELDKIKLQMEEYLA